MTRDFWYSASIRALRTIAQTAVATIGTAIAITEVDWRYVVSASLLAGILSVLTSIATGLPEVEYAEHIYMDKEEPLDSYSDHEYDDYEVFDYGDEVNIPSEVDYEE